MDFEAKVIQYLGEQSGTSKAGNPWKKKEWVVETFGQFPRKVKVQCFGERSDSLNLEPGRDYILSVDLESREFNGRWYTDVSVFRAQDYNGAQNFGGQPQQPYQGVSAANMSQQGYANPAYPGPGATYGTSNEPFVGNDNDSDEDLPF